MQECSRLFGFSQPRVLPRSRDALVVAAEPDVGAIVLAELQRLVFRNRNRDGASQAGVRLLCERVLNSVHTGLPAEPVIPVKRSSQPRLEVVAQVPFK